MDPLSKRSAYGDLFRAFANFSEGICARYPRRETSDEPGCPPCVRHEYEAVPLETIIVEVGDERKVRKEGRRLACANRGASFRAARCAPRLHLPKIHHLRVSSPSPSSPAPFTSSCLLSSCTGFPFPSVTLLSHLSQHSTADNESLLTGDYLSPSREAEYGTYMLLREGLKHCESVLEESCIRLWGRMWHDESWGVWSLLKFRCRASYSQKWQPTWPSVFSIKWQTVILYPDHLLNENTIWFIKPIM